MAKKILDVCLKTHKSTLVSKPTKGGLQDLPGWVIEIEVHLIKSDGTIMTEYGATGELGVPVIQSNDTESNGARYRGTPWKEVKAYLTSLNYHHTKPKETPQPEMLKIGKDLWRAIYTVHESDLIKFAAPEEAVAIINGHVYSLFNTTRNQVAG